MLSNSVLLALAATGVAASYHQAIHPAALAAKRDIYIAARQTQTDDGSGADDSATACLDSLLSVYSSLPTPPPEILSWEQTVSVTDPCDISVPSSLSSAFSSYEGEAFSWYTQHSSEIFQALSQCPQLSSMATGIAGGGGAPVCTDAAGIGGGAGGSGTTTTTTGSDEDNTTTTTTDAAGGDASTTTTGASGHKTTSSAGSHSSSAGAGSSGSKTTTGAASTASGNAGPRETGFVAGAVAVAGFLGVVAAL